jgi:tRNA threonylcarbamoyladenosine biosynthesis protein TsaB
MIVLAIDTSTLTASCAVVRAPDGDHGGVVTVLAAEDGPTSAHSERILPLVARVAAAAGIAPSAFDAFAVGAGPGSFTGLRIGMATAKGLAFASGRPLWVVSSLAALALDLADAPGSGDAALYVPVLDARRGEIYAGFYRRGGNVVTAVAPERVIPPAELAALIAATGMAEVVIGGDALAVYPDALAGLPSSVRRVPDGREIPSAVSVARLALAGDRVDGLAHGAPAYIRPSEAEVKYPDGVPGARRRA